MQKFKLSIICVTYNAANEIEETISSLVALRNEYIQLIIIDGQSNDGTIEIIQKYSTFLDVFVSEKDSGIYDAMNKGITFANGDFILFINSGDKLIALPELDAFEDGYDLFCFPIKTSKNEIRNPKINWFLRIVNTLPHQGIFYRNTNSLRFDANFHVFADFDLNQLYYKKKSDSILTYKSPIVSYHSLNGISNNSKYTKEFFSIINKNYGFFFVLVSKAYFKIRGLIYRLKKNE